MLRFAGFFGGLDVAKLVFRVLRYSWWGIVFMETRLRVCDFGCVVRGVGCSLRDAWRVLCFSLELSSEEAF